VHIAFVSMVRFRHVHASSAIVLAIFAIAHVFNHSLAIVSLGTHTAVLHVLRLVYRHSISETILVAAVTVQVCTGLTMVWKYSLRRAPPLRNLQLVSGAYLAVFLVSHLITVFTTRQRGIDTDLCGPLTLLAACSVGYRPCHCCRVTPWRCWPFSFIWPARHAGTLAA
jgi:hypothetical protein